MQEISSLLRMPHLNTEQATRLVDLVAHGTQEANFDTLQSQDVQVQNIFVEYAREQQIMSVDSAKDDSATFDKVCELYDTWLRK